MYNLEFCNLSCWILFVDMYIKTLWIFPQKCEFCVLRFDFDICSRWKFLIWCVDFFDLMNISPKKKMSNCCQNTKSTPAVSVLSSLFLKIIFPPKFYHFWNDYHCHSNHWKRVIFSLFVLLPPSVICSDALASSFLSWQRSSIQSISKVSQDTNILESKIQFGSFFLFIFLFYNIHVILYSEF